MFGKSALELWTRFPVECVWNLSSRLDCTSAKMHSNYERDSFFVQSYNVLSTVSPHKLLH